MIASTVRLIANLAILGGSIILLLVFGPLIVQEVTYRVRPSDYYQLADGPRNEVLNINPNKILTPIDREFGIVIPKINANSQIIKNVDPNNSKKYQLALSEGVAHADGSGLPNETGNVFLFSHSAGNFYESSRYNAIFYLLNKLENNDEIYIYYKNRKYTYKVTNKQTVDPSQVSYLSSDYSNNSLVLMTCWPPGTTLKRLLVTAQKQ